MAVIQIRQGQFDGYHQNQRAWVIGTGPSLKSITARQWAAIDSEVSLGVNNIAAFHDVQYLLFADAGAPKKHAGIATSKARHKFMRDTNVSLDANGLDVVPFSRAGDISKTFAEGLYYMGASAHAAINLALIMGCNPLVLLGLDYHNLTHIIPQKNDDPEKPYIKSPLDDPTLLIFARFADYAKSLGRTILNANPESALDCFPKTTVQEVLNG